MNKEQKLGILLCIGTLGFHNTFEEIKLEAYDPETQKLVTDYLNGYKALCKHIGFPDDLELLEDVEVMQ